MVRRMPAAMLRDGDPVPDIAVSDVADEFEPVDEAVDPLAIGAPPPVDIRADAADVSTDADEPPEDSEDPAATPTAATPDEASPDDDFEDELDALVAEDASPSADRIASLLMRIVIALMFVAGVIAIAIALF